MKKRRRTRSVTALACLLSFVLQISVVPGNMALAAEEPVRALHLQVEYQTNPLGIDIETPHFSWRLDSAVRSVKQTDYEIQVSTDPAFASTHWTSGKIHSDQTVGIAYAGSQASATRYYWRVTSYTSAGNAVSTETAYWETGLRGDKVDAWGGAQWIAKSVAADLTTYTIDYDFRILQDGAGLIFASNGTNYLMWQFNTNPKYNGAPLLRPHRWNPGGANLSDIDISGVMPNTDAGKTAWYHCKIAVTTVEGRSSITTSLGPVGGAMTVISNALAFETAQALGKIGFRQIIDGNNTERADFDNIVIRNAAGATVYAEDFSDGECDLFSTGSGTIQGGTINVEGQTFIGVRNTVEPPGGEPLYRKDFTVNPAKTVASARLYATACGYYEFSVNGRKVGDDYLAPGWTDYNYTLMYQTYDVTDMLRSGANTIGGMTGKGWFSGNIDFGGGGNNRTNVYGDYQALLGRLVITYTDNSKDIVLTDNTWKYHPGPILSDDNYMGETYDARLDCAGWNSPGYSDASWLPVVNSTPLKSTVNIVSQTGASVKKVGEFSPVNVTPAAYPNLYTYNFGQNFAGFVQIKVKGPAGMRIKIKHGEMLNTPSGYREGFGTGTRHGNGDGPIGTIYTESLRVAGMATDYYTLKGDPNGEVFTPRFTFHGFQYIEITSPGLTSAVPVEDIKGIAISSDNEMTGSFETSSAKINQLYSNIKWGQFGNFVSVPTDCPNRDERLGYTGDTQIFARTATYIQNADQFYAKWLRDLRDYQLNENSGVNAGLVPVLIPAVRTTPSAPYQNWSAGWGDAACVVPWQMYQQYGDKQVIHDAYDSMKAWCDFLRTSDKMTNNLRKAGASTRDNNYGDWVALVSTPKDLTNTMYAAYSIKLFAKMAAAIGRTQDAQTYAGYVQDMMNAMSGAFFNADGTFKSANATQTAYAMLIYFGLGDEAKNTLYGEKLMDKIKANSWKLNSGFIGVSYLCPALSATGQMEAAYKLLEQEDYPSWLYSVNQGATTCWEQWDSYTTANGYKGVGMNSFNHYAFGSVGEWMFSGMLGIQRDEAAPGYRHFVLEPQYGGSLTYAKGHYSSVSGEISTHWTWDKPGGRFSYAFTVPANTTATLLMPANAASSISIDGVSGLTAAGVTYVGYDAAAQRARFEVGSGSYAFSSSVEIPPVLRNVTVNQTTANMFSYATAKLSNGNTLTANLPARFEIADTLSTQLTVKPYNTTDYVFDRWTAPAGEKNDTLALPPLTEDLTLSAGFKWIGQKSIFEGLANSSITCQQSMSGATGSWGYQNLIDGMLVQQSGRNGWTSNIVPEYPTGAQVPMATVNMGSTKKLNQIKLYPRTDAVTAEGKMAGFPRDFIIEGSDSAGTIWTPIVTAVNFECPMYAPAVFNFDTVQYQRIRLRVNRLGATAADDAGNWRVQLTEFGAYYNADLTVNGGQRSGVFAVGSAVTATADAPSPGYLFDRWEAQGMTLTEDQAAQPTLAFTMPEGHVTLTAKYKVGTEILCQFSDETLADAAEGELTADVVIPNAGGAMTYHVIAALYNADGSLNRLKAAQKAIPGNSVGTEAVSLPIPKVTAGMTYRLFVWDAGMLPCCPPFTVE